MKEAVEANNECDEWRRRESLLSVRSQAVVGYGGGGYHEVMVRWRRAAGDVGGGKDPPFRDESSRRKETLDAM